MTLKELSQKEDLIFVGGFAMNMHRLKETYGDVDVVVTNLNGIVGYIEYKTDSAFLQQGKGLLLTQIQRLIFLSKIVFQNLN